MKEASVNFFTENLQTTIERHLSDSEFTVFDLSRAVFLSHTTMYRKLKASTGKTPSQFIRKIKMRKAVELLADSKLKISEVAYELGFSDPAYFSKVFKKEYGEQPGKMRTRILN